MSDVEPGLARVEQAIGYRFRSPELLHTALTHSSYANEMKSPGDTQTEHYERLEFLGDALLGFFAAEELYRADRLADEGLLTRRKQIVVRTRTLSDVAGSLGLGDAMRLSRGELATGGRDKGSLLADVFEAVLAAVYLDGGIRPARAFVRRHLGPVIRDAGAAEQVTEDYKTRFQEQVQSELRVTPIYRIVSSIGPGHRQVFGAVVQVGAETVGSGEGTSRKKAEQAAALDALNHWKRE
ncbi:MAG: ribonuclease III [Acidobacteria bacterium]|uniref:Ribonuclease 3 n=1 Tax=Candidatus Polarisedimenticola svalbardensis TaxID=2886004 RepID=A0A8J6Y2M2_9BACT|nr:ribonuclease III [Candidatus Polarisedimenticola svalbardensis]